MIKTNNNVNKSWLPVILFTGLVFTLAGCSGNQGSHINTGELSGSVKILGSNTVTPLSSVWAEEFIKMHPKVNIAVSGPGTGAGIAALINDTIDICQASRTIKLKEIDQAKTRGIEPYEIKVATDALSLVVNPTNPVSELTIGQLSAIYTNEVSNWNEVGGNNAPIVVISRDTNSGTHVFFKEHVVQMQGLPTEDKSLEYGSKVLFLPSTEEGVSEVARNPNAIFYPGLGYVTSAVNLLAIKKMAGSPAVLPSVDTALDGTYPIARPLLYYTKGVPVGTIKAYIDYCLSSEGQDKVTELGYVPLN